jgi:pyruvate/2-oxoglutarate dehydrogenase complex dihydrolipoamide acyltransferase (E2) component
MGESIAEGTITTWIKQVGEDVRRDESILEISTDKVDADIPSPASGTLVEILVEAGQTVEVGSVIARIETEAGAAAARRWQSLRKAMGRLARQLVSNACGPAQHHWCGGSPPSTESASPA